MLAEADKLIALGAGKLVGGYGGAVFIASR